LSCDNRSMAGIARKIGISDEDRETLLKWKRSPTTPQRLVRRADIMLAAAEGLNNKAISEKGLGSVQTVCLWRKRHAEYGIEGLNDQPKPGRPRTISRDKTAEIVATTLTPPEGMTHWSARILTNQAIRRGSFDSVAHLVGAIKAFLSRWNEGAKPFVWTKTAEQVLAKAVR